MKIRKTAAMAFVLSALAAPASAQVGHPPDRSPYTDLEFKQEATLFSGYYNAAKDPAGVLPRGGPLVGARYDLRLGGPAYLTVKSAGVITDRTVLDPAQPSATRDLGSRSSLLFLADVGLTLNLTGQKSFRKLVPVIGASVGIASDFKSPDVGQFEFGTPFALSYGAGVKWVPGGRTQWRLDVTNYVHKIKYPDSYFIVSASDGTRILRETTPQSFWKGNLAITVGASYLFFR